jgi:glycosyltransferase involved in cell wall biosynthesis
MSDKTNLYRPVLVLAPGIIAGAEKVVLTGIMALYELGLNPIMVIIKETRVPHFAEAFKEALPSCIDIRIIESTQALDFKLYRKLKNIMKNENVPLVLHSHGFKSLVVCCMAKGKARHVYTHHGATSQTFKIRVYEKIALIMMRTCNQVIAVSTRMKEELKILLKPYKKITVVENMLSLKNTSFIRKEKLNQVRPENGLIKLIYVGRLSSEKGLLPFLVCLSKFPLKERFQLSIVGDGEERSLVEEFIQKNKLSSIVVTYGMISDLTTVFSSADLLVMPSLREGLPLTLIEALASGVPVLANNVGAISSLVKHKYNGYLTSDNSRESWNEALSSAITDYSRWTENVMLEAEGCERRFSAKLWAEKTHEIYQKVLGSV